MNLGGRILVSTLVAVIVTAAAGAQSVPAVSSAEARKAIEAGYIEWAKADSRTPIWSVAPRRKPRSHRLIRRCWHERREFGGPGRDRTDDLFHAVEARSQLCHRPTIADEKPKPGSSGLPSFSPTLPG
jgi:hypothetical protein